MASLVYIADKSHITVIGDRLRGKSFVCEVKHEYSHSSRISAYKRGISCVMWKGLV